MTRLDPPLAVDVDEHAIKQYRRRADVDVDEFGLREAWRTGVLLPPDSVTRADEVRYHPVPAVAMIQNAGVLTTAIRVEPCANVGLLRAVRACPAPTPADVPDEPGGVEP